MINTKKHTFLSDWGLHLVMLAVALPILGLAYLSWTALPASMPPEAFSLIEPAQWRALDVIGAFRAAGLSAEIVRGATKDERDFVSTYVVVDARRFRISEKEGEMGMVLCFKSAQDLERMKNYYLGLNRSLPQFRSWIFVHGNTLLQINSEVPESTARAYAAVLDTHDQ